MQQLLIEDVLSDIEFELAQGLVLQEDLGQGVQAIRTFQNKLRAEMLEESRRPPNMRAVVTRLFQVNDMLITLCQELVTTVVSLRQSQRRVAQLPPSDVSMPAPEPRVSSPQRWSLDPGEDVSPQVVAWLPPDDVVDTMRTETLQVDVDVRVSRIPIIGKMIDRFKMMLHSVAVFYAQMVAQKQLEVNRVYGEWLLRLLQLSQEQQRQIDDLNARLATLTPQEED